MSESNDKLKELLNDLKATYAATIAARKAVADAIGAGTTEDVNRASRLELNRERDFKRAARRLGDFLLNVAE